MGSASRAAETNPSGPRPRPAPPAGQQPQPGPARPGPAAPTHLHAGRLGGCRCLKPQHLHQPGHHSLGGQPEAEQPEDHDCDGGVEPPRRHIELPLLFLRPLRCCGGARACCRRRCCRWGRARCCSCCRAAACCRSRRSEQRGGTVLGESYPWEAAGRLHSRVPRRRLLRALCLVKLQWLELVWGRACERLHCTARRPAGRAAARQGPAPGVHSPCCQARAMPTL